MRPLREKLTRIREAARRAVEDEIENEEE